MSDFVKELIVEYANQDNRSVAYPIYVTVQELVSIGVMHEGYSVNCPFGDGENHIEYRHSDLECSYDKEEDLIEALTEYYDDMDKTNSEIENIEALNVGCIWTSVEFFLTIKGAEEYIKANQHNYGKLRTYVHCFEYRNFEMRRLLEVLGFKTKC